MIYKKILPLTVVVILSCANGFSQQCNGTFTGRVLDEANQPVVGAAILFGQNEIGMVTDVNGSFSFDQVCAGEYQVKISYLGFKNLVVEVVVAGTVSKVFHLKEDVRQLAEVVIEDEQDHAEHAHVTGKLNAQQLAEAGGKSLGESLKEIPGVNSIQAGPGIFKPVIHGVHSQRVLILNHGIRQEGQQWGAEHAPEIDPFIASNVVVIKDASSIKYGTDAIGGVIVVNPAPLPETSGIGGTFHSIIQSNGRSGTASGMLEGGIKNHDGWGWRLQGTAKRTGDFETPKYVLSNTGIKEIDFSAAVGYHKNGLGLEAFFSHFQSDIGILKGTAISSINDLIVAMGRDIPQNTRDFTYTIGEPRQELSHNLLKVIGHLSTSQGEFNLQYGFQNNNRAEFDIRRGTLSNVPTLDLQLNTHTLEAEWETSSANGGTFCLGVTGMFQNNKNEPGTQIIPFIPNFNSASGGAFAIAKINVHRWVIDVGARYDYRHYAVTGFDFKNALFDATIDFNNISATVGGIHSMKNNQSLHFNVSSSWRPPNVAELYSSGRHQSAASMEYGLLLNDSTNEVMDIDQVSFKNEQSLKWVASYQKKWHGVEVEVSPYINYIFNYIFLRPVGITQSFQGPLPALRYSQTNAMFVGLDVSVTWQMTSALKLMPKISLLRASDETNDDYLIYIPSNWYEVVARYEKPVLGSLKNFYVESKTRYVSKQRRAPRVVGPQEISEAQEAGIDLFEENSDTFDFMPAPDGYFLWNVSSGISVKQKKVQYDFRIAAENVLNNNYREYTNRFRYYADELGRNFILSIKCIF